VFKTEREPRRSHRCFARQVDEVVAPFPLAAKRNADLAEIWPRLQALTLYGSDIFVLDNDQTRSLWGKSSGFDPAGLDYLIERSKGYYDRRQRDRTLMKGDRVAVLGRRIAVVEHADDTEVHALLRNRITVRMRRNDVAWNQRNLRWEAKASAP
jgi:hypothetical protein